MIAFMPPKLPTSITDFASQHPEVWSAFAALADACHEKGGPLDEKTRRIAKLALAVGMRHEGAVHSAARQALDFGVPPEELDHVAILAITTLGWPNAQAALTWIRDVAAKRPKKPGRARRR
jgi:alkylhydroperoxidase/carboxymuconolactone decarboxylase family protein YurZ